MNRRSKEGFVLSALLHGSVVGLAVVLPMIDLSDRSAEKRFELVPMPPLSGSAGGGFETAPPAQREFDFSGPDIPAPPTKRKSKPAPTKPDPTPAQPPPPKPTPPKPAPTATPAKPAPAKTPAPTMSYADFVKKHGAPKPTATKPRANTGGSSGRAKGPRVDTDFSGVVRDSVVGGSRYGSLTGTEMSALGLYIANLRGALEDAWPKPSGMADSLATIVEFSVSSDGRITSVRVAVSSGNRTFDQSVLGAFEGVDDAGPPPDGKPLQLRLTFKMNED